MNHTSHHSKKNRITEADYPDIKRRYEAGESMPSIARSYRRHPSVILHHIQKMGLSRDRNGSANPKSPTEVKAEEEEYKRTRCAVLQCQYKKYGQGLCRRHYILTFSRAQENNIIDKDGFIVRRPLLNQVPMVGPVFVCDHKTSRCECINPGKHYKEYKDDA